MSRSREIVEELENVRLDLDGIGWRSVSLDGDAFFVDKELCKVPLDRGTKGAGQLCLEELVNGMCVGSIDVDLGEDWERGVVC